MVGVATLEEDLLTYKAYSDIAYNVIVQAAEDYFEYKRAVNRGVSKYGQKKEIMEKYLQEVVDFFENKNGYYKFYCDAISTLENNDFTLTGEKIMKLLDSMVEDEEKYPGWSISLRND